MSNNNAKAARRYFEEILGEGRFELLEDVFAANYSDRTAQPGRLPGIAGVRQVATTFRAALPDVRVQVEDATSLL